jgi:hypothetical protein
MKAIKKLTLMILTCFLMTIFVGNKAYAASGTISLSDPTAAAGDSVSVTVKVTASGSTTIKSVTMELSYDAKVLEFDSGTAATGEAGTIQLSGTADSAIKTYTLEFKALKSGTANIKIVSYDIKDSNDTAIEMSKVGYSTVTVSGDTSTNTDASTDSDTTINEAQEPDIELQAAESQSVEAVQTEEEKIVNPPKKNVEVEIAGTPFYVCKITEDIIPEGFEYIGYMYEGAAVDALKKDNVILFYLNQIGEEPYVFYVYDEDTSGFSIYAPIYPNLDYYVVNLDEGIEIPEGFTETEVSVGGVAVSSWQSDTNSEYYLLYLMTSEGSKNLYLYDVVEKTVQRYYYSDLANTQGGTDSYQTMYTELNENYNKDMQSKMRLIYGLIILSVGMLFLSINLSLKLSDKRNPIIDEDEEEEDDIAFSQEISTEDAEMKEWNEQYNHEDDYEDDYEEDNSEEVKNDKQLKKEMKKAARLEKKELAKKEKAAKKMKKASKEEILEDFENKEDDYDDSDDFELQIFDLDDDQK